MRIPGFISETSALELRRSLRQPGRNDHAREGIRHEGVRKAVEHVAPPFFFVTEPLEGQRRYPAAEFHRRLDLDDMRVLVRNDVAQPVVRSAQFEIQR